MTLSVLIVDDSGPFRVAAQRLLERQGLAIVGTASTAAEAVLLVEALRPQVVLVDVNLVGTSGFELTRELVGESRSAGPAVVLMSTHSEEDYVDLIASSPAAGFVAKEHLSGDAIRTAVCRGTG